jgi:hypothetical protein
MKKNTLFKEIFTLLLLIIVLISGDTIIKSRNSNEIATKKISQSLRETQDKIDSISANFKVEDFSSANHNDKNVATYIFINDSLTYWSSDINDPNSLLEKIHSTKNVFQQGNKTFYVARSEIDSVRIFTSALLYHKNPHQGKNTFVPQKISGHYEINFFIEDDEIKVNLSHQGQMNNSISYILGILLIIILAKTFSLTYKSLQKLRKDKNNSLLFFFISTLIFFITILLQRKLFLSTSELFGQSCLITDSTFSFSLGELAEFTTLLYSNIIVFTSYFRNKSELRPYIRVISSHFLFGSALLPLFHLLLNSCTFYFLLISSSYLYGL